MFNKYYNTNTSLNDRLDRLTNTTQQNNNSFKECPDFRKCKCEQGFKRRR